MAKAKKSIASPAAIEAERQKRKREPHTPVSIWSRSLRRQRDGYRRRWGINDAAYCGGPFDRGGYNKTRDVKRLSTQRVYESNV